MECYFTIKIVYGNKQYRDITLPTKVRLVKAMVFPVIMYGCESWTVKKAEHWRIDAFELWRWRRLLRVPWTARRSNQSILKEISPGISLEGMMLKLKLQYFGHLMRRVDSLEKILMLAVWGQEEKGMTEDDLAGWHHWLNGHESEWMPGVGDGQGGLVCCDSWGLKESDTTEQLNWTELRQKWWINLTELGFIWDMLCSLVSICNWKGNGNPLPNFSWRIPWTEKPDGLHFMWLQRIRHGRAHTHTHIHTHTQTSVQFSSVAVVSDSLQPHEPQHARPSCPSPTPRVYSNSYPLRGDTIQPSHPLSSPPPPAFNLSQHQGLFKWVNSLHQVARVLEFQLQHQSFQRIIRTDFL